MSRKTPLVITAGQVEQAQLGDNFGNIISRQNGSGATITRGTPVRAQSATDFRRALATSVDNAEVVGFCVTVSAANGANFLCQTDGVVEATTSEWDAVTGGSGGLTAGSDYFLSVSPGQMSTTPPSSDGQVVVKLGRALSTTELRIDIGTAVLL